MIRLITNNNRFYKLYIKIDIKKKIYYYIQVTVFVWNTIYFYYLIILFLNSRDRQTL